ncbi:MAG: magnesium transporter [Clostridia bacterium]|nr:magnesium transporter [Clostridia bacterium]MBO5300106.1 magnesium transporter [Clostridia bacterium]
MTEETLLFLEKKDFRGLREFLCEINPADIAILLSEIPEESLTLVFRLLPKELAAETFVEMDGDEQEFLLKAFSDKEIRDVLDELYVDDTVDIIEEMPANVVRRILALADSEMRAQINEILHYPKNSAGSIMTTEFVDLKKDMTVAAAFERIRRVGVDKETIYTCYVIDDNRHLLGLISVKTLLLSSMRSKIEDIMETNIISVSTLQDREDVGDDFVKYGFLAMPVVDNENRLVGIVTIDDAIDVIQEENTEDIEKMAAITPTDKTYMKTGIFETWIKRIPWLLLLMISAAFTGKIITIFEDALAAQIALTAFIPMLMDSGGNAGSQASVSIIRGLALNEIEFKNIFAIWRKEFVVSILCGITLAAANFVKILLIDRVSLTVAAVVCITLFVTIIIAKLVGCTLPILAKKIGFDPAVMASPFITTIVDALSLLVYFNIASALLGI